MEIFPIINHVAQFVAKCNATFYTHNSRTAPIKSILLNNRTLQASFIIIIMSSTSPCALINYLSRVEVHMAINNNKYILSSKVEEDIII